MSDLFASRGTADHLLARAAANSVDSFDDLSTPGFFTGFYGPLGPIDVDSAVNRGVMRGGAKAATGLGIAAGGTIGAALDAPTFADLLDGEKPESTAAQDAIFGATENIGQSAIDFWAPRPNEVGRAGQVLGGLAEVALPLVATAGNPSLLVGSTTATAGKSLVDQGVDAGTAAPVAALEGLATYAGLKTPIVGKNLLTRMASGALGNVAVGSASRAAEKAVLDSQGFAEQGKMYAQDGESFSTDFLLGLLFGGVHHVTAGKSVNVEQNVPRDESSQKLGDLPMRGSGEGRATDLSVMPSDLSARLAEDAYPNLGTAEKVELQGLRERLQEAGQADPAALPEVWKREIANASRGLRQAIGGDLAVPAVSSGTSQPGDINPRLKPSDVDAILALRNTNYFARETAPGVPADTLAAAGHQSALETAINQLSRGEPVDVGDAVARHEGAEFVDDGRLAENARLAEAVTSELDAPDFGLKPPPRTIDDADPILQPRDADTSPERLALRDAIVNEAVQDAPTVTGRKPIAILMGGGGASGKGTILKQLIKRGLVPEEGAVHVDPDSIKAKLPEYDAIVKRGDSRAAAVVHEESSALAKRVIGAAIAKNSDIVLDRTLADVGKALKEIKQLKDAGYEVRLFGVTVDPLNAIRRADKRAQRTMRFVPPRELLKAHKGFANAFETLAAEVDSARLFDNEVPEGTAPKLLAQKDSGKSLDVADREAYNAFRERGNINSDASTAREVRAVGAAADGSHVARRDGSEPAGVAGVDGIPRTEPGRSAASRDLPSQRLTAPAASDGAPVSKLSLDEALAAEPGEQATPEIAALAQLVDENPDAPVLLGFDENGEPRRVTVAQALDEIRTEYEQAINDTKAYDAAVSCFMGHG